MPTPRNSEKLNELKAIVAILAAATAEPQGEVNIMRQGDQIILPPNMDIPEAIKWLEKQHKADSVSIHFNEPITGYPLDAAHALGLAIKEMFGYRDCSQTFWPPPKSIGLEIDADGNTEQVYVGKFQLPNIDGEITLEPTGPMQLTVDADVKARFQPKIKELVTLARQMLKTHSVYRGNAFKLKFDRYNNAEQPKFIRTGTLGQLQVNADTRDLLEAAVWVPITKTARCRLFGIPLKRGVLLEGPYGTGKSLFATETATVAHKHGWTYIYLEDIRYLAHAYEFAAFYAPCVLFAEDIDTVVDSSSGELPESIRNIIDAVNTKNNDIILVLTTNHVEKLPKSVLRPGRLDAVIPFRAPDAKTVEALLRQYAGDLVYQHQNISAVCEQLAGRFPAVITEVAQRAKLQMVKRSDTDAHLTSQDLSIAADSMSYQISLQEAEPPSLPSVAELFGRGFGQGAGGILEKYLAQAMRLAVIDRNGIDEDGDGPLPPDQSDIEEVIATNSR